MIAITLLAFTTYSVIVFTTYYALPFLVANTLLTVFLAGYVMGIIPGGSIADRIDNHDKLTAAGFVVGGTLILAFSLIPVSTMMFDSGATLAWFGAIRVDVVVIGLVLFAAGASFGVVMPSRDMIVRKVAPEGSTGRVFGFVYSALDLGGAIAPAAFGWIIAINQPQWLFRVVAIAMTIAGLSALLARILPKPVTLAAE
jgi:FSR family fosmidomycin resistance protein-like MFS transporter